MLGLFAAQLLEEKHTQGYNGSLYSVRVCNCHFTLQINVDPHGKTSQFVFLQIVFCKFIVST